MVHPYYLFSPFSSAFLTKSKVSFITSTTLIRESRICLQLTEWQLVHHSNFNKRALKTIFIKEVRIISPRQEYIKKVSDLQLLKSADFSSISSSTSPLIILLHISSQTFSFQPVCRIPTPFFFSLTSPQREQKQGCYFSPPKDTPALSRRKRPSFPQLSLSFFAHYNKFKGHHHKMQSSLTIRYPAPLASSMFLPQEKLRKSPQKQAFSPTRLICPPFLTKLQGKKVDQKIDKQLEKSVSLTQSLFFSQDLTASTLTPFIRKKESDFIYSEELNKGKLAKIKEKYQKEGSGLEKYTTFAKKKAEGAQKKDKSGSFTKQIEAIMKRKDSTKAEQPQKAIPNSTKQQSRQNQLKVLTINSKKQVFEILKFIDQGSYGKVHLVQHLYTNALYCLKTIEKSHLDEQSFTQLVRQCKIQSFLNHPNIVNLYCFTADAQAVYLLLQACPGDNLYKRLSGKPMKEKDVRRHIKEICGAVEYMHKNDIIHRDIKPQNILIVENTVKICDFGWAVHSPLLRNTQCGTPLYTPPEMVKSQYYDSKIDIWCIGILTYQLLFGTIPFEIRHHNDLSKIVSEKVFFSKEVGISEQAKHFIGKCLEKNANERYNIRQALEDEFVSTRLESSYRHTMS